MRTTFGYMCTRILLLVIAVILFRVAGARGLLLLALAFAASGIASFVLLSRQRDVMSGALMARLKNRRERAPGFRARLEAGTRAEDEADAEPPTAEPGDRPPRLNAMTGSDN
jgi:hypothetical protein